jgi:hypothetical protein
MGHVAIHPSNQKLTTALRTAVENEGGMLDKEVTSHDGPYECIQTAVAVLLFTFKILNRVARVSRLCQVQKRGDQC